MHTSVSVQVKYTTQMLTVFSLICLDPSFQKMAHHFLLHGSLRPSNLEENLKLCQGSYNYFKPRLWVIVITYQVSRLALILQTVWIRGNNYVIYLCNNTYSDQTSDFNTLNVNMLNVHRQLGMSIGRGKNHLAPPSVF